MAVTTREPAPTPPPAARARGSGRDRPRNRAELWWWIFMRVSGIILLVLAVGHVLIMHVFEEGVDRVDFAFVALRWQSIFWKTWDWLMLTLAMIHGVNGLRMVTLDYVRRGRVRTTINWFFATLGALLFALGTYIVVSFDPAKWPGFTGS